MDTPNVEPTAETAPVAEPAVSPAAAPPPAPKHADPRLVVRKRVSPEMPAALYVSAVGFWTCPVRLWVEPTGAVARVERPDCDERLRGAAEAAARQWQFERVATQEKELPYDALFVFRSRAAFDPKDDLRVDVQLLGEFAPWTLDDGGLNWARSMGGGAVGLSSTHTASMLMVGYNGAAQMIGTEGRLRLNANFSPYLGARTSLTRPEGTAVPTLDNSLQFGLDVRPLGVWSLHFGLGPAVMVDLEETPDVDPALYPPVRFGLVMAGGVTVGVPLRPAPSK